MKIHPVVLLILAGIFLSGCQAPQEHASQADAPAASFKRTMESTIVTDQGATVDRFTLYSPSMKRDIRVAVVLPPAYFENPGKAYPVLYALHGANAPYDTFANMPMLREELNEKPFIVTCFDGDAVSRYIDSYHPVVTARRGEEDDTKRLSLFTTFFFDEFMPAIDRYYRVDEEKRGLTGFSMGGGGAFHYMLEKPELFISVSGMSSAFYNSRGGEPVGGTDRLERMLGSKDTFPERFLAVDHYYRLEQLVEKGESLPPILLMCGSEDWLLGHSREMYARLKENGLDVVYEETPGAHNWQYWHPASVRVAAFHWEHFQ